MLHPEKGIGEPGQVGVTWEVGPAATVVLDGRDVGSDVTGRSIR